MMSVHTHVCACGVRARAHTHTEEGYHSLVFNNNVKAMQYI